MILNTKQQQTSEYLEEVLGSSEHTPSNQKTKESLIERKIIHKNTLTDFLKIRNAFEKKYGGEATTNGGSGKSGSGASSSDVDSRGAFRVSTLGELRKAGCIANVDFGSGVLYQATKSMKKSKKKKKIMFDLVIKYYFSNRNNTSQMMAASAVGDYGGGSDGGDVGGDVSGSDVGDGSGGGGASAAAGGEGKESSSDHFIVTSVYENDFVVDEFELSTDDLVSLNKSSLSEWRPTGSNTTFNVEELLTFMKDLQLRELLLKVKKSK